MLEPYAFADGMGTEWMVIHYHLGRQEVSP